MFKEDGLKCSYPSPPLSLDLISFANCSFIVFLSLICFLWIAFLLLACQTLNVITILINKTKEEMTLEEYKIKNNLSYYVLGQQLGCESINPAVMAQRYCQAKRFPRPKMIIKIEKLTNNQVTMRDILDEYIKKNK